MFHPKHCHKDIFAFVQRKIESLLYNSLLPDGLAGWVGGQNWSFSLLPTSPSQVSTFPHHPANLLRQPLQIRYIEFRERANPPNVESLLMLPTPRRHLLANSGGNEPNWDTFNRDVISEKLGNLSVLEKVRKK